MSCRICGCMYTNPEPSVFLARTSFPPPSLRVSPPPSLFSSAAAAAVLYYRVSFAPRLANSAARTRENKSNDDAVRACVLETARAIIIDIRLTVIIRYRIIHRKVVGGVTPTNLRNYKLLYYYRRPVAGSTASSARM